MTFLGTFSFGRSEIEVHRTTSEISGLSALWLRRIDDGPEVTVAVLRESGLAFAHNVAVTDQAGLTEAFEQFMTANRR